MFKNEKNKILACFFQVVFFFAKKTFVFFQKKQACFFWVATLDATDGSELKLFNLVTKIILPEDIQHDILDTTDRGERALSQFVQDRLNGEKNMWHKMPQIKYKTWE